MKKTENVVFHTDLPDYAGTQMNVKTKESIETDTLEYLGQQFLQNQAEFKYSTWSIMKLPDLTAQEKVALAFVNKFSAYGGITTSRLQKELDVSTPTFYKVINRLLELGEVEHGERQGLWVVTETKKLF